MSYGHDQIESGRRAGNVKRAEGAHLALLVCSSHFGFFLVILYSMMMAVVRLSINIVGATISSIVMVVVDRTNGISSRKSVFRGSRAWPRGCSWRAWT